jgi:hypothetical protein
MKHFLFGHMGKVIGQFGYIKFVLKYILKEQESRFSLLL